MKSIREDFGTVVGQYVMENNRLRATDVVLEMSQDRYDEALGTGGVIVIQNHHSMYGIEIRLVDGNDIFRIADK